MPKDEVALGWEGRERGREQHLQDVGYAGNLLKCLLVGVFVLQAACPCLLARLEVVAFRKECHATGGGREGGRDGG